MEQHYSPPITETLGDCYSKYQQSREDLHSLELNCTDEPTLIDTLDKALDAKAQIAKVAMEMYRSSGDTSSYIDIVEEGLASSPRFAEEGYRMSTDNAMMGAYLLPLSLLRDDIPSPVESICATAKNLEIAHDFIEPIKGSSASMLMSGTNAWGAFYAVKGGVPDGLKSKGIAQLPYGEISDIDLLVSSSSISGLGQCVSRYVESGLVSARELDRFTSFEALQSQGEADIFSLRSYYRETEESIHFVPEDVLRRICQMEVNRTHVEDDELRYDIVRDFRPNIPGNIRKHGAYPLGDIRALRETSFRPNIKEIKTRTGLALGYLSENTVGGPVVLNGEGTYYMGVFAFFMAVSPTYLVDDRNELSELSSTLRHNISKATNGADVKFIPRQERMAAYSLMEIKHMLKYGDNGLPEVTPEQAA